MQSNSALQQEFREELTEIADWWLDHTVDHSHGGFYGELDFHGRVVAGARKGVVLNTRILWFFSETSLFLNDERYRSAADRAYNFLVEYFYDHDFGGMFWEVDCFGVVTNTRKQIYAQAFAVYAFSAYFKLSGNEQSLSFAKTLFKIIEKRAVDPEYGGYLEAFSREWGQLADVRLSEKDLNSPKSMNTHLHITEAYTALHAVLPRRKSAEAIVRCIGYFDQFIINRANLHLRMFLGLDWRDESYALSFGHDIECSWLIWEALEVLQDAELQHSYRGLVVDMAQVCLQEAVGKHGEVYDAFDLNQKTLVTERHWWVQAEALVGFLNAYELTADEKFSSAFINAWKFIKQYQKDSVAGEWHWFSILDHGVMDEQSKVCFWKAPYHNGRAMMEICKRLSRLGM